MTFVDQPEMFLNKLQRVSKMASADLAAAPQRLKPRRIAAPGGTAKAVPFPKPIFETSSSLGTSWPTEHVPQWLRRFGWCRIGFSPAGDSAIS